MICEVANDNLIWRNFFCVHSNHNQKVLVFQQHYVTVSKFFVTNKFNMFRILIEKIFQIVSRQITFRPYLIESSENGAFKGR